MTYLIATIFLNVANFLIFRWFKTYKVQTFQAIVINYFVVVVVAILYVGDKGRILQVYYQPWLKYSLLLGVFFIFTFNVIAKSTQKLGVTITTLSSKISVVLPVLFSLYVLRISEYSKSWIDYLGIVLAISAIIMVSMKNGKSAIKMKGIGYPIAIFFLSGIIDIIINYASEKYISSVDQAIFPMVTALIAGLIGLAIMITKKMRIDRNTLLWGVLLGIPNYFSVLFLIKALAAFQNDGAILFPVYNIGIIVFSSIFAVLLFKEKLSKLNMLGIVVAVMAILLMSIT